MSSQSEPYHMIHIMTISLEVARQLRMEACPTGNFLGALINLESLPKWFHTSQRKEKLSFQKIQKDSSSGFYRLTSTTHRSLICCLSYLRPSLVAVSIEVLATLTCQGDRTNWPARKEARSADKGWKARFSTSNRCWPKDRATEYVITKVGSLSRREEGKTGEGGRNSSRAIWNYKLQIGNHNLQIL